MAFLRELASAHSPPMVGGRKCGQQAVEKQPAGAAKEGRDDESSAQAVDSSRASPGLYRTGEMKNDLEDRFSTTC
jgi:hypothetical protein